MTDPSSDGANPRAWLIDDWRWVIRRAWSMRLIMIATLLSGLEVGISVMVAFEIKPPIPAGIFAALAGLVTVAAGVARFIAQTKD